MIHLVSSGCQRYIHILLLRLEGWETTFVQLAQVVSRSPIRPNMIQDAHELRIPLPIDFAQFDRHQVDRLKHMGREEEGIGIKTAQYLSLVGLHHGLQLKHVAHEQQLFPSERHSGISREDSQNLVNAIYQVGSHHRDLVDNNQLYFLQYFSLLFRVLKEVVDASSLGAQVWIVGHHRPEREFKERVQRNATRIDSRDACWCQHHILFLRVLTNVFQEG